MEYIEQEITSIDAFVSMLGYNLSSGEERVFVCALPSKHFKVSNNIYDINRFINKYSGKEQIYISINPVRAGLSSHPKETDVVRVVAIYIDCDAVKPKEFKDYAATDNELKDVVQESEKIRKWLIERKFNFYHDRTGNGVRFLILLGSYSIFVRKLSRAQIESWKKKLRSFYRLLKNECNLDPKKIKIDSVIDIRRLSGVPGTLNIKKENEERKNRVREFGKYISFGDQGFRNIYEFIMLLPEGEPNNEEENKVDGKERDDEEINAILDGLRKSDKKIDRLLNGDWSGYQSRSEAELALCVKLIEYGFSDSEIFKIVLNSGIGKLKEKEEKGYRQYFDLTLKKAKEFVKEKATSKKRKITALFREFITDYYFFKEKKTLDMYLWIKEEGELMRVYDNDHKKSKLLRWMLEEFKKRYGEELTVGYDRIWTILYSNVWEKNEISEFSIVDRDKNEIIIDCGDGEIIITKDKIEKKEYTRPWKVINEKLEIDLTAEPSDIKRLFEFLNMEERDKLIFSAYVASCYLTDIEHPICFLKGVPGCGKTTTLFLASEILLGEPIASDYKKNPDDLSVVLYNNYLNFFDNIEKINSEEEVNVLSRAVTGALYQKRKLFRDYDIISLRIKRVMFITSATLVTQRADLLDRLLIIQMPKVNFKLFSEKFKGKSDIFFKEFKKELPKIRGAIVKILQHYLRRRENVELNKFFRFSNFAEFFIAFSEALGIKNSEAVNLLKEKEIEQKAQELTDNLLVYLLEDILHNPDIELKEKYSEIYNHEFAKGNYVFVGTAAELLRVLKKRAEERDEDLLIKNANSLSRKLTLLAPLLEDVKGIRIERKRIGKDRNRVLYIWQEKEGEESVSDGADNKNKKGDDNGSGDNRDESNNKEIKSREEGENKENIISRSEEKVKEINKNEKNKEKVEQTMRYLCESGRDVTKIDDIERMTNISKDQIGSILKEMNIKVSKFGIINLKEYCKESKRESAKSRESVKISDTLQKIKVNVPESRINNKAAAKESVCMQLLDIDYEYNKKENQAYVLLYGRGINSKAHVVRVPYSPYFYTKEKPKEALNYFGVKYEVEEKYLPYYYQENKTKLYKICLKNPKDVPKIRDYFSETYESDIPFVNRFLIDKKIGCGSWIKVINNDVYLVNDEYKNVNNLILSFDIEVASSDISKFPDPHRENDEIVLISLVWGNNRGEIIGKRVLGTLEIDNYENYYRCEDENELISSFEENIKQIDPDIIVGYNISNFDLPYIIERASRYDREIRIGRSQKNVLRYRRHYDTISSDGSKQHAKGEYTVVSGCEGRIILDVYELLSKSVLGKKLQDYSLETAAREIVGKEKYVEIGEQEEVRELLHERAADPRLIDYCLSDSVLTFEIFVNEKYLDKLLSLARVSLSKIEECVRGQNRMVSHLLMRYYKENERVVPNTPNEKERKERMSAGEIKGAKILDVAKGLHKNVVLLDFASLYPSIVIAHNVSWDTETKDGNFVSKEVKEGILPEMLRNLLEQRRKYKKMYKETKNEIYNDLQYAYKIMANSAYGYSGFVGAKLFSLKVANRITALGRDYLEKVKAIVERTKKGEVIAGDTDSIFVKIGENKNGEIAAKEIIEEVEKEIPETMKLEYETSFESVVFLEKKRYIGITKDGERIEKGVETVRRDWCPIVKKAMEDIIFAILKENSIEKAKKIRNEYVEKLRKNEYEFEDLILTRKLSKAISEYATSPPPHVAVAKKMEERGEKVYVGERIKFVIVKGKGRLFEKAEIPGVAKKENIPLDIDYYIDKQLLPPIDRILLTLSNTPILDPRQREL